MTSQLTDFLGGRISTHSFPSVVLSLILTDGEKLTDDHITLVVRFTHPRLISKNYTTRHFTLPTTVGTVHFISRNSPSLLRAESGNIPTIALHGAFPDFSHTPQSYRFEDIFPPGNIGDLFEQTHIALGLALKDLSWYLEQNPDRLPQEIEP